jgi:hypothetical protein
MKSTITLVHSPETGAGSGRVILLVATSSALAAGRNPNPGVLPVNSHAYGKSYGDWGVVCGPARPYSGPKTRNLDTTGEFCHVG